MLVLVYEIVSKPVRTYRNLLIGLPHGSTYEHIPYTFSTIDLATPKSSYTITSNKSTIHYGEVYYMQGGRHFLFSIIHCEMRQRGFFEHPFCCRQG